MGVADYLIPPTRGLPALPQASGCKVTGSKAVQGGPEAPAKGILVACHGLGLREWGVERWAVCDRCLGTRMQKAGSKNVVHGCLGARPR
jgi:hypothetical protein